MNVKNNKRRKESIKKIESAFIEFIQTKELNEISVSDICKVADINRSTFYANFVDIYDLADKIKVHLEDELNLLFDDMNNAISRGPDNSVKFFQHIKDNQLFYHTYFKLGHDQKFQLLNYNKDQAKDYFDDKQIAYHVEFFRNGLNAVIKMWLNGGCQESPEEIAEVIRSEYMGR